MQRFYALIRILILLLIITKIFHKTTILVADHHHHRQVSPSTPTSSKGISLSCRFPSNHHHMFSPESYFGESQLRTLNITITIIANRVSIHYNAKYAQHQEPVISAELKRGSRVPTHTFEFRTQVIELGLMMWNTPPRDNDNLTCLQIWRPRKWKVKASYKGGTEAIPTVVVSGPSRNSSFLKHTSSGDL